MYHIRKYVPQDKERLRFICKETADKSLKRNDRLLEAVAILYNDYFTEKESENIFVLADESDLPVGYIICTSEPEKFRKAMRREYRKRVFRAYPSAVVIYLGYMAAFDLTERKYRVHFHIDLLPEAQRQGWGTKLMNSLCEHLREKGIEYLGGVAINKNSAGYRMYKKYGFETVGNIFIKVVTIAYKI
jgi:ribosomal protein S18 acetylase RimI-like enzyme